MSSVRPTKEQLKRSNVRVEKHPGVTYRIPPIKALLDPIKRFLPPAGPYYDQSTLKASTDDFDSSTKCVLCWNPKAADQKCVCKEKCAACKTKQHRGRECPKLYADIKWWQAHGHRLRKKAQLRPNPGERAYLAIAGVFKNWKRLEDPVIVNMEHPVVKAFYKDKEAPQALTELSEKLQLTRPATAAKLGTIPLILELDTEETTPTADSSVGDAATDTTLAQSGYTTNSCRAQDIDSERREEARDIIHRTKSESVLEKDEDSFLNDLLEDTWQPSSYHEGSQCAAITPLSIKLAVAAAKQFAVPQQPATSTSNEVRSELGPLLKTRTQIQRPISISQPPDAIKLVLNDKSYNDGLWRVDIEHRKCKKELEDAQEEIKAKDRRIRELEIALHETEGWTDAVTYRVGLKRSML